MKAIYFAILDSHINYANLIWGQNPNSKIRIIILQKKAFRIINIPGIVTIQKTNNLKFEDEIIISNIIFISKSINNLLLPNFENWFIFCSEIHNYDTISSSTDKLFKLSYRADSHDKNSLTECATNSWNKTHNMLGGQSLNSLHLAKIKNILTQRCINKYQ